MKRIHKRILSIILAFTMLFLATVPVFAVEDEEYLSDLRLIYADDYNEASEILAGSELEGYKLYKENLNANTGKTGVFIAYKTTTDIEDAITDIAVMQMNGGYKEGNYQQMIEKSYAEYVEIGNTYLEAIDYFKTAYGEDDFLAKSVYRQLNLYTGIDDHDDERLGDVILGEITSGELATMFMEGNKYVLSNIRSLLAMGVSYNEDGKHYLEKVADEAAAMDKNPNLYQDRDYLELASIIAGNILTFGDMFNELAVHESELDYTDETFTELELEYAEYTSFADRMREVNYLGGKSLYDFCLEYKFDKGDLTSLYPLVAALNDGQVAMTRVSHYYDVVLYSMSDLPEESIESKISSLEEQFADVAFDVYAGVDRSIYDGTFALTSDAYRANAYTESGFWNSLVDPHNGWGIATITTASISLACAVWGICRTVKASMMTNAARNAVSNAEFLYNTAVLEAAHKARSIPIIVTCTNYLRNTGTVEVAGKTFNSNHLGDDIVNALFEKVFPSLKDAKHGFDTKVLMLKSASGPQRIGELTTFEEDVFNDILSSSYNNNDGSLHALKTSLDEAKAASEKTAETVSSMTGLTHAIYVASGVSLLVSAITMGVSIYNYYNPTYDDIPTAMVDLIDTADGDRYIKYDVVFEAEAKNDGTLVAGDLNAFQANRWNALYYTKSYEAGKPLLAGEFVVSSTNNTSAKNYMPVHRFGEVVSYNLNKYNFNDDHTIYLSVKQSNNQKAAVADVPELVGSVFSTGYMILSGVAGVTVGVGGTIGTRAIIKRRKNKEINTNEENA